MSKEKTITPRKHLTVQRALVGLGAAVLFSGAAFAQNHTSEAVPQTNTKSQVAAEAKKNAKPMGTKSIKDGSTAEGEGSGVKKTSKPGQRVKERPLSVKVARTAILAKAVHRSNEVSSIQASFLAALGSTMRQDNVQDVLSDVISSGASGVQLQGVGYVARDLHRLHRSLQRLRFRMQPLRVSLSERERCQDDGKVYRP